METRRLETLKQIAAGIAAQFGDKCEVVIHDVSTSHPERTIVHIENGHVSGRQVGDGASMVVLEQLEHQYEQPQDHLCYLTRTKDGIAATVKSVEYDPNRTARIALLVYADGEKSYIIAPNGLQVGQTVMSGAGVAPEVGNTLFLSEIPLGTVVHNIELYPGQGAAMARSAGSYAQLLAREGKFAVIKLPSGETRMVLVTCRATVGVVSNVDHSLESSGKAGRERWLGRRPRNRGVVMNPVDHPMGGGEGRASGGHPRSRKGLLAKGYKTRNPKKTTSKFIISKKKK